MAGLIGLDYVAVHAEAKRLEIDLTPRMMRKIKLIESIILNSQNKGATKSTAPTEGSTAIKEIKITGINSRRRKKKR